MYTLVSAIAKALTGNQRWVDLDIGDVALDVLFSTYSDIIAVLSNPYITGNVAVNLETIRSNSGGLSITFNEFLVANGNNTLTPLASIPTISTKYAKYADAFHAGYTIVPINEKASIDSALPLSEKTWLHMSKTGVDYELFYKSCLVNVNGFFHLTDYDTNGIYIKDGMKSQFLSGRNGLGILSFRELGELSFIQITKDMVYKQNTDQSYSTYAYIDLGVDVSDKTVMLVLGGYLHVLDTEVLTRISDSRFRINFKDLSFLERFYESRLFIDLGSLGLSVNKRNLDQVAIDEILGDDCILNYLTLSQSFFVILNNSDLFTEKQFIRKTPMPDMFISYQLPNLPLITGIGKVTNYWYTLEDGQYSITCGDSTRNNYIFNTTDATSAASISNARVPGCPTEHSLPYMLEIGSDIV